MSDERLHSLTNATLLLRLVFSSEGQLDHGSVVTLEEDEVGHFRSLQQVEDIVQRWLHDRGRTAGKHPPHSTTASGEAR